MITEMAIKRMKKKVWNIENVPIPCIRRTEENKKLKNSMTLLETRISNKHRVFLKFFQKRFLIHVAINKK